MRGCGRLAGGSVFPGNVPIKRRCVCGMRRHALTRAPDLPRLRRSCFAGASDGAVRSLLALSSRGERWSETPRDRETGKVREAVCQPPTRASAAMRGTPAQSPGHCQVAWDIKVCFATAAEVQHKSQAKCHLKVDRATAPACARRALHPAAVLRRAVARSGDCGLLDDTALPMECLARRYISNCRIRISVRRESGKQLDRHIRRSSLTTATEIRPDNVSHPSPTTPACLRDTPNGSVAEPDAGHVTKGGGHVTKGDGL
ncbi:unnamed protein product [Lampetra planeri]